MSDRAWKPALVLGNCYFDHRSSFSDFDWTVIQVGEAFVAALAESGYEIVPAGWAKEASANANA